MSIAAKCKRCGYIGCNGNNMICSARTEELVKDYKESLKRDFGEKGIKMKDTCTTYTPTTDTSERCLICGE